MGWEIIKQPNGHYAVWSTVVDAFNAFNATREEVIDHFVERSGRAPPDDNDPDLLEIAAIERRRLGKLVDAVDDGTINTLRPSWSTWDECIAWLEGDFNKAPGEGKKLAKEAIDYGTNPSVPREKSA